jgi:hypothetical protein
MKKLSLSLSLALLVSTLTVNARTQTAPPAAPLPSALATASKVFIGNAGDQENADCLRAYNVFYSGLAALGRFQLVTDPNAADLVLELHYEIDLGGSLVSTKNDRSVRQFRVVIEDPHTRIVLWSLTERTNYALLQKNRDKNLDETVAALVKDFALLAGPQAVAPNNKSLIKH